VSIIPLTESGSPHIEYTNDKEHRVVASETSIVLDYEENTGCRRSHTKNDVIVNVMNMIRFRRAWNTAMMLPPTTVLECITSRACRFLPLLGAMKATNMAN
jgi:hypothetical protein